MGSSTNNRGLYKPSDNEEGWASAVNSNFDELDSLPEYDDVSNAPADDGFIVYVTGDGATTPEGLYQRQSGSYVHIDPSGAGVDVEDSGTATVSDATTLNFGDNLTVTDDSGTATVDAASGGSGTSTLGQVQHFSYEAQLSDEEIARFAVEAGEQIRIWRLACSIKGGGTDADVTLELYDTGASSVLASVTGGGVTSGDPIATAGDGDDVIARISNSNDVAVTVATQWELGVV